MIHTPIAALLAMKWQVLPCFLPLYLSSSGSLHCGMIKKNGSATFYSFWSSKLFLKGKQNAILRVAWDLYLSVAAHLILFSGDF